jgi:hypothetical protein
MFERRVRQMSTDFTSAAAPQEPIGAPSQPPSTVHTIFMGPNGIRAGWRLLLFLVFFIAFGFVINFVLHHVPSFVAWANNQSGAAINASFQIATEGLMVVGLFFSVWVMSKIEKRSFADYGLPLNEAFGKVLAGNSVRVSRALASAGGDRDLTWILFRRSGDWRRPGGEVRDFVRRVFHISRNL